MTNRNALCNERSGYLKERIAAEENRIRQLEKASVKLSELSVQMGGLLRFHEEKLDEHNERLYRIEAEPRTLAQALKTAVFSAGISGIVSYLITRLT